jgi:AbrB family looped-hinge helix DNA binding protein
MYPGRPNVLRLKVDKCVDSIGVKLFNEDVIGFSVLGVFGALMVTGVLPMETTRLSTKGQIVLPKNIRISRAWTPGTEFTVEETGDGILLRPAGRFPRADLDDVVGCLQSKGKSKTLAQMSTAVGREVIRRHDRGRF